MSGCWLRGLLCLFLVLILAAATAMTVLHFDLLDLTRMSGPAIIGLLFFAIAILGIYAELASGRDDAPATDVIRRFFIVFLQIAAFIMFFVGGDRAVCFDGCDPL